MAFDWGSFLSLSAQLASATSEAEWRTAVSRAYYGCYHICRQFARERTYCEPSRGRHSALMNWFKSFPDTQYQTVGMGLERLYYMRLDADYKYEILVAKNRADAAVSQAKLLLAHLRGLTSQLAV